MHTVIINYKESIYSFPSFLPSSIISIYTIIINVRRQKELLSLLQKWREPLLSVCKKIKSPYIIVTGKKKKKKGERTK
jgi:hypothetical protein